MNDSKRIKFDAKELFKEGPGEFIEQNEKFQEIMMIYNCAMLEVRTKLEVINAEFKAKGKGNPINSIKGRIKKPRSIYNKISRLGIPNTIDDVIENINDIAGIRVICPFINDIRLITKMLENQDDIKIIRKKDYITKPKKNGYRSMHLIIEIPVFFSDKKQLVRVEVQIRTIAMDFWASLEHQIYYKKNTNVPEDIRKELLECANTIAETDFKMQEISKEIKKYI